MVVVRHRFFEAEGKVWRVFDVVPVRRMLVSDTLSQGWICFETEGERRRLSPIPTGWASATDLMLTEWLAAADAVSNPPFGKTGDDVAGT